MIEMRVKTVYFDFYLAVICVVAAYTRINEALEENS